MFGDIEDKREIARGYCRVSTTMQGEDGVSLDTQQKKIKGYCELNYLNLVKIYEDSGLSGKDMNRPQLMNLINDMKENDRIIVSDLSRLSRSTKDALIMLEKFKEKGIKFVCLNPNIDTSTPVGELMFTVLMAVHKLERENIASHVSRNMQQLSKDGKLRARPPFGWKFAGKDKDYIEDSEQQECIEKIKHLYIDGGENGRGMKYAQIARKLNEEGANVCLNNNKRGGSDKTPKFYPETVKRILIDTGLVTPSGKDARIPINARIISHRKERKKDQTDI